MQVIGRSCEIFSESFISVVEASACSRCDLVYHTRCLEDGSRCPSCGVDFEEAIREESAQKEGALAAEARRGKSLLLVCLGTILVFRILPSIWSLLFAGSPTVGEIAFPPLLSFVCGAAYIGYPWAKRVLQILLGISFVLHALMFGPIVQRPPENVAPLVAGILVGVAVDFSVLCTLTFSRSVTLFLGVQREST